MKKKNFLFFPILFVMGIGLFSCNFGNTGNVSNYVNTPAVATFDMNLGMVLGTPYGYMAAPELTNINDGDCIYMQQFTIDYNNQPSSQYTTATNIVETGVGQSYLEMRNDSVGVAGYTLPFSNVGVVGSSPFFQGKLFLGMTCPDNNPALRLVYNSNDTVINGAVNLYLLAKPSSTTPSTTSSDILYAFDLSYFIQSVAGRDTTVAVSGTSGTYSLRYIQANIKYLTGISADGVTPIYTDVLQNPYIVAVFNNY